MAIIKIAILSLILSSFVSKFSANAFQCSLNCRNDRFWVTSSFRPRSDFQMSTVDDDVPSDYDTDDLQPTEQQVFVDTDSEDAIIRDQLKRELLLLASVTKRGEFATNEEKDIIIDLVTQLEALNPSADPASQCTGDWDLVLTSTQAFRSSPFFQSIRALFSDENKDISENAFDLHNRATAVGRIGRVRQSIDSSTLVSEVDLEVGLMGGMPFRIKGTVVTSAELDIVSPEGWNMKVLGTRVKGSNVPFLDQLLDDYPVEVPVGDIYGQIMGKVPVIVLKTFYVDEGIRITRDVDNNFYVFSRT